MGLRKWRHVNYLPAAHSLRLMGKVHCCISGATTETEVFREPCFCSDRAVFDTIGAIIHTALLQLVTTIRSKVQDVRLRYRSRLQSYQRGRVKCPNTVALGPVDILQLFKHDLTLARLSLLRIRLLLLLIISCLRVRRVVDRDRDR